MKRQIEGELAWRRLLGRQVEPFVNISDDEVKQVLARLQSSKGATEYHVGEIYLSANPNNQDQVLATAHKILDSIHNGGSFVAYAHEYSEASTRAVGGDRALPRRGPHRGGHPARCGLICQELPDMPCAPRPRPAAKPA